MASRHYYPPLTTPLRVRLFVDGVRLLDEQGRTAGVLSPEQLLLLAFFRAHLPGDPGEALGMAPDQRRLPGPTPRRTPAERAALSRSLSRLAFRGLVQRRCRQRHIRLTRLGEGYTDWLFPQLVETAASGDTMPRWLPAVAAACRVALRRPYPRY